VSPQKREGGGLEERRERKERRARGKRDERDGFFAGDGTRSREKNWIKKS